MFRLTERDAADRLRRAVEDAGHDAFWLLQPEIAEKEAVRYVERDGTPRRATMTVKYSCFYGPTQLIGMRTMHRRHFKVHGQDDTVVGVAIPGLREESVDPALRTSAAEVVGPPSA